MDLEEHQNKIRNEIPYVDVKPYSHRDITLHVSQWMRLAMICNKFGKEVADDTIKDLELDKIGWIITENKNK